MSDTILDEVEGRVLGCLIEKAKTTPELYPITLNALVAACNQKSSRDPVVSLEDRAVEAAANRLAEKGFAARRHEPGGRAVRFGHRVEVLLASEDERIAGLICVLLLRGPQTIGELKTRTERLCQFPDTTAVETLLQEWAARPERLVEKLPRQPGQKEARWRQRLTPVTEVAAAAPGAPAAPPAPAALKDPLEARVEALEKRIAALEEAAQRVPGSKGPSAV